MKGGRQYDAKLIVFVACLYICIPWQSVHGFQSPSIHGRKVAFFPERKRRLRNRPRGASNTDDASLAEVSSDFPAVFPDYLINALDLVPLLHCVSRHTGTRRGHQALLSLVKEDQRTKAHQLHGRSAVGQSFSARRMRAEGLTVPRRAQSRNKKKQIIKIAQSAEEARNQYVLVEEAMLALDETADPSLNLSYPPFYRKDSHPGDISSIEDTDNDEWLMLPAESWTLEFLLQAEKVIETLLATRTWATLEETRTWMGGLASIGAKIDNVDVLLPVLDEIKDRVEIVRVSTLPSSPSSSAGYYFRLKAENYPVLKLLRQKLDKLMKAGAKELDQEVMALQREIDEVEAQIRIGMAQLILSIADVIDEGLDLVAHLDVIFSTAAFGLRYNGLLPRILDQGIIDCNGFVHPVLLANNGFSAVAIPPGETGYVTPVDLRLSTEQGRCALLISGSNGGGKTLAMKSFGVVCVLTKLGIPIPSKVGAATPRVDFVDHIQINIGDNQDTMEGESTWTSLLNSCSRMIECMKTNSGRHLVLLDELGSGTDPEAGGAVAQAILEEFLKTAKCQVVATTHSPRLKALSYESDDFSCASVVLTPHSDSDRYREPTYRLEYGIIGESYALEAASRCKPKLPDCILSRVSQLLSESEEDEGRGRGDYIQALTSSMETQLQQAEQERAELAQITQDARMCRKAMVALASSYDTHLERLQQRLDDCYLELRNDKSKNDLEVIGETLAELKANKRRIKSETELLKEKGLKVLPSYHKLAIGESVVLIRTDDGWDGLAVEVVADSMIDPTLGETQVMVRVPSSFHAWGDRFTLDDNTTAETESIPWIVQRHQLATWDYDSIWEDGSSDSFSSSLGGGTSIPNSKKSLTSLLSSLKTESSEGSPGTPSVPAKNTFSSSRARKSAKGKKGKR